MALPLHGLLEPSRKDISVTVTRRQDEFYDRQPRDIAKLCALRPVGLLLNANNYVNRSTHNGLKGRPMIRRVFSSFVWRGKGL